MPVLASALAFWQCALLPRAMVQEPPRFPASAEMVKVSVAVAGAGGRAVPGLRREDFEVWADGRPQRIAYFGTPADAPDFDVAVAVDTSGSLAAAQREVATAAARFLYEVSRARLRLLVSFDNEVRFWKTSAAPEVVVEEMRRAAPFQGATALRTAIHAILGRLRGADRAAVVVLTDGADEGSFVGPEALRAAIQSSNVTIYPVRYVADETPSDEHARVAYDLFARKALADMAAETGGRLFDGRRSDPARIFRQIAEDLEGQYVLGFVPDATAPGVHTLRVKARGGSARHRLAYRVAASGEVPVATQAVLAAIAREARGKVGLSAVLVETGERLQVAGDERFPMQSVFKLPVALQVLHLVDEGKADLAEPMKLSSEDMRRGHSPVRERWPGGVTLTVEDALRWMLVESDNSTADALLARAGGPAAVTARLHALGVKGVRVDRGERELAADLLDGGPGALKRYLADPRDTATPNAMADLLVLIARGQELKPATHARLVRWLEETQTGLTRIRGLLPKGTVVADRTGTGPTTGGVNACTNDVGIITLPDGRHVALAVLTKASPKDQATRERTIARLARGVYDHWVR